MAMVMVICVFYVQNGVVDMRQFLISLFLLSRPADTGDVLKFAFHVSNFFGGCCAS